jgi:acyl-CoA reductase-like NAD-dependent aldehyde dehydrogenase
MSDYKMLINGELVEAESGKTFPVMNPATGQQFATIALGGQKEVDKAVAAAKRAFPIWSKMPVQARAEALRRIGIGIRERAEEIAKLDTMNHGSPISVTRNRVMGASFGLEGAAGAMQRIHDQSVDLGNQELAYVRHHPIGVCALITPWNVPLLMAVSKMGPALIVGNTCVVKPPSVDSATTLILGEIITKLGNLIPLGVINIITGSGDTTGNALCAHPDVGMIGFTGSCDAGKSIMAAASGTMKKLSLELGGKNPFIVMEDADVDKTAEWAVNCQTSNSGQICASPGRYLVHEKVHDEFASRFIAYAKKVTVGDPLDPATRMGPLVSEEHRNKVVSYIKSAVDEGAQLALGQLSPPGPPLDKGYYVLPTVLTGVTSKMQVYRDEIFGPVACITKYGDKDNVIAMANDNTFGLTASVWSKDTSKAVRVGHQIEAGTVYINDHMIMGGLPFAGVKESGLGAGGIEEYIEVRSMYVYIGEGKINRMLI